MTTASETTRRRLEVQGILGLDDQDNLDLLLEKYARPRPDAVLKVGRAVLGYDVDLNGYTTVAQAQALHKHLALSSHTRLLDVGAGHGWPGSHLAASSGCSLVATDIPVDALRAAKRYIGQASAVSADGRELPFLSGSFDAVVHADVFC